MSPAASHTRKQRLQMAQSHVRDVWACGRAAGDSWLPLLAAFTLTPCVSCTLSQAGQWLSMADARVRATARLEHCDQVLSCPSRHAAHGQAQVRHFPWIPRRTHVAFGALPHARYRTATDFTRWWPSQPIQTAGLVLPYSPAPALTSQSEKSRKKILTQNRVFHLPPLPLLLVC